MAWSAWKSLGVLANPRRGRPEPADANVGRRTDTLMRADAAEAAADPEEGVEPSDMAEDQAELAADPEETAEIGDTGLEDFSSFLRMCKIHRPSSMSKVAKKIKSLFF